MVNENVKGKTGSGGRPWVVLESPRPPKVKDHYQYWGDPPPELSERCKWWLRQIMRGWRPPRRIAIECYDCSAEWYGIWIWEFNEVICPALGNGRMGDHKPNNDPTEIERILAIPENLRTFEEWIKLTLYSMLEEEIRKTILEGDGNAPQTHAPPGGE